MGKVDRLLLIIAAVASVGSCMLAGEASENADLARVNAARALDGLSGIKDRLDRHGLD